MESEDNIQTSIKYFIYPLNSLIGHSLIEAIKESATTEHSHKIMGRADKSERAEVPLVVDEVLKNNLSYPELFQKIEECDIVIYETLKADPQELEYLLNTYEEKYFQTKKRIIFISSPMLWYHTYENCDGNQILPHKPTNNRELNDNEIADLVLSDKDFDRRRTLPCYEMYRLYENKLLGLNDDNTSIQGQIIYTGFVYGRGEDLFYDLFTKVFDTNPEFHIYGDGSNSIPTIHVCDLIDCIMHVLSDNVVPNKVSIAVDDTGIMQRDIIRSIAALIRSNNIRHIDSISGALEPLHDEMTIDIELKRSECFDEAIKINELSDTVSRRKKRGREKFSYITGLMANLDQIFDEFVKYRDLRSKTIALYGPQLILDANNIPANIAEAYDIEIYYVNSIIDFMLEKGQYDDYEPEKYYRSLIMNEVEVKRKKIYDDLMVEHDKNIKLKKKNIEEPIYEEIEVDVHKTIGEDLKSQIVAAFFALPFNKYKGCLLANYPLSVHSAELLAKYLNEKSVVVDDFIFIEPNIEYFDEKVKDHNKFGLKDMTKRLDDNILDKFKVLSSYRSLKEVISSFKKQNYNCKTLTVSTIEVKLQDVIHIPDDASHEAETDKIARKVQDDLINKQLSKEVNNRSKEQIIAETNERKKANRSSSHTGQGNSKKPQSDERPGQLDLKKLFKQEEKMFEERLVQIKQYLADNLMPEITEGIIEISRVKPEKPIDFLIDFLKQKAVNQSEA